MVAIKSLLIAAVLGSATMGSAAPQASAFELAKLPPTSSLLSDLYDEYLSASRNGNAEELYSEAPVPTHLLARGQCPNKIIPKCASLVATKNFASVLATCGNCIKESSLCVEVLPFAKLSKTICKFAKHTLQCSAIRLIGWETHFTCTE
ncbi:hypothetical protein HKX48_002160 [Thoreauomyces humboldtii]|nr:hypothetical protein HKX48_002160 [Thoreauomyces humboldtii]